MATTKPRITVTLTKRQHDVLKVISECGGRSMSAFISEMLELSLPTLERMAATFQKIKASQDIERARVVEALDEAQSALEPIAMAAIGQFDLFLGKVGAAADVGRVSPPAAALAQGGGISQPPSANRGVTPRQVRGMKGGRNAP